MLADESLSGPAAAVNPAGPTPMRSTSSVGQRSVPVRDGRPRSGSVKDLVDATGTDSRRARRRQVRVSVA